MKGDPVRGFGGLEAQVMDWLWRAGQPMTVREVLDRLNADRARPLAYTSVLTVLDNLFRKDAVPRAGQNLSCTHVHAAGLVGHKTARVAVFASLVTVPVFEAMSADVPCGQIHGATIWSALPASRRPAGPSANAAGRGSANLMQLQLLRR